MPASMRWLHRTGPLGSVGVEDTELGNMKSSFSDSILKFWEGSGQEGAYDSLAACKFWLASIVVVFFNTFQFLSHLVILMPRSKSTPSSTSPRDPNLEALRFGHYSCCKSCDNKGCFHNSRLSVAPFVPWGHTGGGLVLRPYIFIYI